VFIRNTVRRNFAPVNRAILDFIRGYSIVRDFYIRDRIIGYGIRGYGGVHDILRVDYTTAIHFEDDFHPFHIVFIYSRVPRRYCGNNNIAIIEMRQSIATNIGGRPFLVYCERARNSWLNYLERHVDCGVERVHSHHHQITATRIYGNLVLIEDARR
jgi:hypothetical protein